LTLPELTSDSNSQYLAKYTMAVTVKITGVPAHRIRQYEDFGLCKPARTYSNQRLYSDRDINLIKQIADLDKNGVNMPGIRIILNPQISDNFAQEV
jgi:MerR family transcriptional regulator, heat shock protein HspR